MQDREELIDLFVEADNKGKLGMWESCYYAYRLFSEHEPYSRETVSVLREACQLDYDAIYNRKYAWDEFDTLYLYDDPRPVPFDSRRLMLTASHFYRLHRLRSSINISDDIAREYIELAISEGWSSSKLVEEIHSNHLEDTVKHFERRIEKFWRTGWRIWEDSASNNMPDDIRASLYKTLKEIEAWKTMKKNSLT
jgi:hypothetical protein